MVSGDTGEQTSGGDVSTRRATRALPVDVRVGDGARAADDVLVEAVLDALPSPTVLLAGVAGHHPLYLVCSCGHSGSFPRKE